MNETPAGETWTKRPYRDEDGFRWWQILAPLPNGGSRLIADKLTEADADRILADHEMATKLAVLVERLREIEGLCAEHERFSTRVGLILDSVRAALRAAGVEEETT